MNFKHHPVIIDFVRNRLGCTCPEDVFDEIDVEQKVSLADTEVTFCRILVGNRLLIYVLKDIDMQDLKNILRPAVYAGKKERDSMKYNRFRLAFICNHDADMERHAHSLFEYIPEKDERIHLHFINKPDVKALSSILQ